MAVAAERVSSGTERTPSAIAGTSTTRLYRASGIITVSSVWPVQSMSTTKNARDGTA